MKTINIKNPQTMRKYLKVLYEIDVLTTKEIADFLAISTVVAAKYLTELKRLGCVIDIRCAGSHYWHLKPNGIRVLEAIEKTNYRLYETTVAQRSKGTMNQNTKHDVYCSKAIMALVESSVECERGIWQWQGPTSVRTKHMAQVEKPFLKEPVWESTYKPDAMIGFYHSGQYGRMYVEYDSGTQYSETVESKVIKAHKTLNLYNKYKKDIILGFITHGGEKRRNNLMGFLKEYHKQYKNLITVVMACDSDLLEGRGWDEVWLSNKEPGLQSLKMFGVNQWSDNDSDGQQPSFIGHGSFRPVEEDTESEIDVDEMQII